MSGVVSPPPQERADRSHLPRGYWRGGVETISRPELHRWQWRRLQLALRHAYAGSEFWRARMVEFDSTPDTIRSLSEYTARFPLLFRDDIIQAEAASPPYGAYPACDPMLAIRHHQTSGTSGNPPLRVFDTARDWAWGADCWATGLYGMGVRSGDVVMLAFGYGMFIGFWGLHYALELIGAKVLTTGSLDSRRGFVFLWNWVRTSSRQHPAMPCVWLRSRPKPALTSDMMPKLSSSLRLANRGRRPPPARSRRHSGRLASIPLACQRQEVFSCSSALTTLPDVTLSSQTLSKRCCTRKRASQSPTEKWAFG